MFLGCRVKKNVKKNAFLVFFKKIEFFIFETPKIAIFQKNILKTGKIFRKKKSDPKNLNKILTHPKNRQKMPKKVPFLIKKCVMQKDWEKTSKWSPGANEKKKRKFSFF